MNQPFVLKLTDQDKSELFKIAHQSILSELTENDHELQKPESTILNSPLGAFVTLKKNGQLRGCIGNIISHNPLYITIDHMAKAAAFNDTRFPKVEFKEYDSLTFEISVLSPITPCKMTQEIELGKHGLILCSGNRRGLLLPQVPIELGWTIDEYLAHLCQKAGVETSLWKDAWVVAGVELYWFEAVILNEI